MDKKIERRGSYFFKIRLGIIKNQEGGGDETPLLNEESHSKTLERLMILQVHNTNDVRITIGIKCEKSAIYFSRTIP